MSLSGSVRALLATWRGRFIAAFLAVQLLLPLAYYIGRHDPHDERFAWRMFSPDRQRQCTPRFTVDGIAVSLGSEFHEAWVEIAKRGRLRVLEAMGARLCSSHRGSDVRLDMTCTVQGASPTRYGGYNLCAVPEL